MSEGSNNNLEDESVDPQKVENEVLQLFDDDILRTDDFDRTPEELAEEIHSQAVVYNRVVAPAADLSAKINGARVRSFAQTFDMDEVSTESPTENKDELVEKFNQLISEDSDVIRSAKEIMDQLLALYSESEMNTSDTVTYQDVYNDMHDVCPETARVQSGTFDVLTQADALDEYNKSR